MSERTSVNAIAVLETRGIVALTAGIEAMVKTADVRCIAVERVSSGYLMTAIEGQLAAVRQALDAGTAAVKRYGELRAAQIYARPSPESVELLHSGRGAAMRDALRELPAGAAQ